MILTIYADALHLLHNQDMAVIVDNDFNIIYASDAFINALVSLDEKGVINKKLHELPYDKSNTYVANTIKQTYEIAKQNGKTQLLVSAPGMFANLDMFILHYNHLPHPEDSSTAGYVLFITQVDLVQKMSLLYKILGLANDNQRIELGQDQVKLTERDQEILFLLCFNLSGREIAEVIAKKTNSFISPHTVGNIVRNRLFNKFGVYNIPALIDKAVSLGYCRMPSKYYHYQIIGIKENI